MKNEQQVIEKLLTEMRGLNANKQRVLDEIKSLEVRIKSLKEELPKKQAEVRSLEEMLLPLRKETSALKTGINELNRFISDAKEDLEKQRKETATFIEKAQKSIEAEKTEQAKTIGVKEELVQQRVIAEEKIRASDEKIKNLMERESKILTDLETIKKEKAKHAIRVEKFEHEKQEHDKAVKDFYFKIDMEKKEISEKLNNVESRASDLNKNIAQAMSDIKTAKEKESDLERREKILKDGQFSLKKDLEALDFKSKQIEIDRLRIEKLAKDKQVDKELKDLRAEINA